MLSDDDKLALARAREDLDAYARSTTTGDLLRVFVSYTIAGVIGRQDVVKEYQREMEIAEKELNRRIPAMTATQPTNNDHEQDGA